MPDFNNGGHISLLDTWIPQDAVRLLFLWIFMRDSISNKLEGFNLNFSNRESTEGSWGSLYEDQYHSSDCVIWK